MTPVWIIEGATRRDPEAERDQATRRLAALAEAVRQHEEEVRRDAPEVRPQDLYLYGRAREICEDPLQRP
jgi:hypothetical protein